MDEEVIDGWEYREGRRCARAAWYHHRERVEGERASRDGEDDRDRLRSVARRLWPGSIDTWTSGSGEADHQARTRRLMAQGCPAIVRAEFEAGGGSVRVDVLERRPDGSWCAILVTHRATLDDRLVEQGALVLLVLAAAAVPVAGVHLLQVNPEYRKGPEPVDPAQCFTRRSITVRAARRRTRVGAQLDALRALVLAAAPPDVPPGSQCRGCPFTAHCIEALPADWVGRFPYEADAPVDTWIAQGLVRMREVPEETPLGPRRRRARLASLTGHIVVDPGLPAALAACEPPVWYLDFECVWSLLPVFEGTGPGQHVPFLWSLHHVDAEGRLRHQDAIAPPTDDPRRVVAETLVEALGEYWEPILVYSDYESQRLQELADLFPDLAPALQRIRGRLVDLLEVVRDHVYDLQFGGRYSLKAVAPVLAPGLSYRGLRIRDGLTAARAYARLLQADESTEDEVETTLRDLRAYCERDTLALVDLHRALVHLARGTLTSLDGVTTYPIVDDYTSSSDGSS